MGMYALQAWGGFWLSDWSDSYLDLPISQIDKDNKMLVYAMIGLGQRKFILRMEYYFHSLLKST
jgi:hypothetical protein